MSAGKIMRALLSLILIGSLAADTFGQAASRCGICQAQLAAQYFWLSGPALPEKIPVCEPCTKLESKCAVCLVPIKDHGRKLGDGRWLCQKHFESGVFREAEALRIYEETRRDLQAILAGAGVLPDRNITVTLVDGVQLKRHNQKMPSEHDDTSILGLTRTRFFPNRQFQHSIYLLDGLNPARLAAVCAHEYTHTWLHENLPPGRVLNRDTLEGFCELVAYKLMVRRKEEIEKRVILANAYTRGQVNAFVQAEAAHHFYRIIQWVKTGVDEVIPENSRVLAIARELDETVPVVWPPPPPLATPVPGTLTLKGISGSRGRRFVLINDCTLTRNEEGRVRVGTSNVVVRCVEIRDRSAVIQVQGFPGATELFFGAD
jgi:hypothetical protein